MRTFTLIHAPDPMQVTRGAQVAAEVLLPFGPLRRLLRASARLAARHSPFANPIDAAGSNTPLHLAVYTGLRDMANLFLAHGADVNAKDSNGCVGIG